jgi:hypothetical protein
MTHTILLSSDVLTNSLLQTGDALVAFVNWKPRRNETIYSFPKADIHITAANGAVYLMSRRETKQAKIAFKPLPAEKIFDLSRAIGGAQGSTEIGLFNSMLAADVCNER